MGRTSVSAVLVTQMPVITPAAGQRGIPLSCLSTDLSIRVGKDSRIRASERVNFRERYRVATQEVQVEWDGPDP
jgi:hypothetical protein